MFERSEASSSVYLDFFELAGRPVVVCRQSDAAWVWTCGEWKKEPAIAKNCYSEGDMLGRKKFVHLHPYAALSLLDFSIS